MDEESNYHTFDRLMADEGKCLVLTKKIRVPSLCLIQTGAPHGATGAYAP